MRKLTFLIFTIVSLSIFSTVNLAANITNNSNAINAESSVELNTEDLNQTNTKEDEKLNEASEEILGQVTEKDKKIAELSDKYNDKTLGTVAYYLDMARYYSTPIFFIFLTIGGFNFFIVGNKKLDKKEQGFSWITACVIGWVVFQCIPLAFALFAK